MKFLKFIFWLALFAPMWSYAELPDVTSQIKQVTDSYYKNNEPGFALAVIHRNKLVHAYGYGMARIDQKQAIEKDTNFRIASVTKQFTAMCILMLEERGKLKVSDDISKYIKVPWKGVRIDQLICHTSGVPDYISLLYRRWDKKSKPLNQDGINYFNQYKPNLKFEPGSKYRYSNTGYMLLASIVEKVSGVSFPEFIEQNIFKPLDMKNSLVWTPQAKIYKRSLGYRKKKSRRKTRYVIDDDDLINDFYGDGAIYSNAEDMAKWAMHINSHKLLKLENWKRIFTKAKLNNGKAINYAYGWEVYTPYKAYGEKLICHSGSWVGFSSNIIVLPERELKLVILSNNPSINQEDLIVELKALFSKKSVTK